MSRWVVRVLWRLAGILLVSVAGVVNPALAQGAPGTAPVPEDQEPQASVSVNGARNATAPRGWPVIVEAVYSTPEKGLAVKLKVTDSAGQAVEIPFERVAEEPADASAFITVHWLLAPEKSAMVKGDSNDIAIQLEGDKGVVATSPSASIKWIDAPAEVPDAQYANYMALLVRYDLLRGKPDDAAAKAAQWRAKRPDDVQPTMVAGDLHFAAGRLKEAAQAYNTAMKQWAAGRPKGKPVEPPAELLARQRAVLAAMARHATKKIDNSPDAREGK